MVPPLGNGYFDANVRPDRRERIQLTENSLANPMTREANNFAEIYIDFGHEPVSGYERDLSLNTAAARMNICGEAACTREYFVSYPDRVMVVELGLRARHAELYPASGNTVCQRLRRQTGRRRRKKWRVEAAETPSPFRAKWILQYSI